MPNVGYEVITGSNTGLIANTLCAYGGSTGWTQPENGWLQSISLYDTSSATVTLALYQDNGSSKPGTLIANFGIASGSGWKTASGTPVALTSGTKYWIASNHTGATTALKMSATGGYSIEYRTSVTSPNIPDPFGSTTSVSNSRVAAYWTYSTTPPKSITISTPVAGSGMVDETTRGGTQSQNVINLTGNASGFTGAIEARFNGGSWSTVATITGDGAWSGSLSNVAAGRGSIEVREVADTGNTASVANFGVGYCFILTGDSNAVGQLTNNQTHGLGSNVPYIYEGSWVAFNTAQNFWIKFAQLLTTETGKPCTFVRHATGSQDMSLRGTTAQQSYNSSGSNYAALISRVAASGITSFNACLCSFGPNAAGVTGPVLTANEYENAIKSFRDNLRSDVGQPSLPVYLGVFGRSSITTAGNPSVRNGIAQAIRKGIIKAGPNVIDQNWSDGVHPKTDVEGATMSARWWAAIQGYRSPRITSIRKVEDGVLSVGVDKILFDNASPIDYTEACFTLDSGTVDEVTRFGDKELRIAYTGSPTTLTVFPNETAIGATIPTGATTVLPATINGISSVVQPIDPIAGLKVGFQYSNSSKSGPVLNRIFKTVFTKIME